MRYRIILLALLAFAVASPASALAQTQPREYTYDAGMKKGVKQPGSALGNMFDDPQRCWSITTTRSRGLWPYGRAIHLYTLWCSKSGLITYRQSSAWPSMDFMCGAGGLWFDRVGGGAGWGFVDVQAQSGFACNSPWWFDWNDFLMQRIRYHVNGYYETIGYQ